jgi:hypothetical protein
MAIGDGLIGLLIAIRNGTKFDGPSWTVLRKYTTSADMSGAGGTAITVAPTLDEKLVLDDLIVSVGPTPMEVSLTEQDTGTVFCSSFFPVNGTIQLTLIDHFKTNTANKKFHILTSAAGQIRVTAHYHSEA